MAEGKVLFLAHAGDAPLNDTSGGYLRECVKNGVLFLDYHAAYLKYGHGNSRRFIREFIKEHGITTVIFGADPASFEFEPGFLAELRSGVFMVMFVGDSVYFFDSRDKYYARAMDLVVVGDSYEMAREFKKLGVDSLVLLNSCDRGQFFKIEGAEKTIDVSFVGALAGRKERWAYINYLSANGINVRLFGYGAPGGRIPLDRMREVFNQSRINLNFTDANVVSHLAGGKDARRGLRQIKGRSIEAALCGAFALCEYAPGIENTLLPGKEMAIFSTREELLEKIRFYLSHEREREAIAENGYRRAIKDYDVAGAIPGLLEELESRRKKRRQSAPAPVLDEVFERNFASYRVLWIIKFLKRFRVRFALEEAVLLFRAGKIDLRQCYTFFVEEVVDEFPAFKGFLKRLLFFKTPG